MHAVLGGAAYNGIGGVDRSSKRVNWQELSIIINWYMDHESFRAPIAGFVELCKVAFLCG
jgi:hypothetical protein